MDSFIDTVFFLATSLLAILMLQAGKYLLDPPGPVAFWKGFVCVVVAMVCFAAVVFRVWRGGLP